MARDHMRGQFLARGLEKFFDRPCVRILRYDERPRNLMQNTARVRNTGNEILLNPFGGAEFGFDFEPGSRKTLHNL